MLLKRVVGVRSVILFLLVVVTLLCLLPATNAETITVGPAPGDYHDIQSAIDDAAAGDTIEVYPNDQGYFIDVPVLAIDRPLTIIGVEVDGNVPVFNSMECVVNINADDVTLDNLVFSCSYTESPAVSIYSHDHVTLRNCQFENYCTGISATGSNNRIIGCSFLDLRDIAIIVESAGDCVIDSVTIGQRERMPDCGIVIHDSSGVDILNSNLIGNSYDRYRGDGDGLADFGGESFNCGIVIMQSDDVEVNGCIMGKFDTGVNIQESSGIDILDTTMEGYYIFYSGDVSYFITGTYGVSLEQSGDVQVDNCQISLFKNGMYVSDTYGVSVTRSVMDGIWPSVYDMVGYEGIWYYGFLADGCRDMQIEGCEFSGYDNGVIIEDTSGTGIEILNLRLRGGYPVDDGDSYAKNLYGILLGGSEDVRVDGCDIYGFEYGLSVYSSTGTSLLGTFLDGNYHGDCSGYGIDLWQSDDTLVDSFDIGGFDTGIYIRASPGTMVNDSVICECSNGISVEGSQGCIVTWCFFRDNDYSVYTSYDCTGTMFFRNTFRSGADNSIMNDGDGVSWNSAMPVSYTYDGAGFAGQNGNYWRDNDGNNLCPGPDDDGDGVGDEAYSPGEGPYAGITDNYPLMDEHVFLRFYTPSIVAYEGDIDIPVFVNLTGDTSELGTIYADVMYSSTAAFYEDYTLYYDSQGIPLYFDESGSSAVFYISTIADNRIEDDEWINFSISDQSPDLSNLVITRQYFNLTILDTSEYPSVSIETENQSASEGGPVVPVTIVRSGAGNGSIDVDYSITGTATDGTDFTVEPSSLHFARGEYRKTVNITVHADDVRESDETIVLLLTGATGANPGGRVICQVTIIDTTPAVVQESTPTPTPTVQPSPTPGPSPVPSPEPVLPEIAFFSTGGTGDEGAFAYILVERSVNLTVPCEVTYSVTADAAIYGSDYICTPAPGVIHFDAGENLAVIKVKIFEDSVAEGPSTALFSLSGASGVTIGPQSTYTLRINDTSASPLIEFYEPGVVAAPGTSIPVVIHRVGPDDSSADVLLTCSGDGVEYGIDFNCTPSLGRIKFAPGESAKVITVNLASTASADSAIRLALSDPHNVGLGNISTFTVAIPGTNSSMVVDPTLSDGTTIEVNVPVSEIVPGTVFGFPGAIAVMLTGMVMIYRMAGGMRNKK